MASQRACIYVAIVATPRLLYIWLSTTDEMHACALRPAFVNTLFPVTRPHHIYSTALVIIIVIDNLKYVIIFIYIGLLPWKIPKVSENVSRGVQISESLGRLIVQTFTTDGSYHMINFQCALSAKKKDRSL